MTVEQFLRSTSKLDGNGTRISYEDRWLVFSGIDDHWVVYHRKHRGYRTRVLYAGDLDGALEVLTQGIARRR